MTTRFEPPSLDELASVDVAPCEYTAECVEVQGLVSPLTQSSTPRTKQYHVHCFSFAAWRHIGGPLKRQELIILRPIPVGGVWPGPYSALSIRRIKVLLSKDEKRAVLARTSWLDDALLVAEEDEDLAAIAEELQKLVVISTTSLGELILNRASGHFEGRAIWNRTEVSLDFEVADGGSIRESIEVAESLWANQAEWTRKMEDLAVHELLALKNEGWLEENEKEVTAEQFKARMYLEAIHFLEDGQFEFWYDDGGLFWGHCIQIVGSLEEGPTQAHIQG